MPAVVFIFVVAFIAAVVLVAAWRDHPVGDVFEMLALVRDVDLPFTDHSDLLDELDGVGELADELELEVGVWDLVKGLRGTDFFTKTLFNA